MFDEGIAQAEEHCDGPRAKLGNLTPEVLV